MKRIIVLLLFLAVLTAAYLSGNSRGQQPTPAQVLKFTKVGVVNFLVLCEKSEKVKELKRKIENDIAPYNARKKELEETIKEWTELLRNPEGKLKEQNLLKGQRIIRDASRQLQDLQVKFKQDVATRFEDETGQVFEEIKKQIHEYAERHGFHMILAYGEPAKDLPPVTRFQRAIAVLDKGGIQHVFAAGGVDVTVDLLKSMSRNRPEPVKNDQPR